MQTHWSRLELGLGMQRPESMIEVLTERGDDYTDLFRRFIRTNDAGFLTTLSSMYMFGGGWMPKSVPRLKELLSEELSHSARRTLQFCFLRSTGTDDFALVESILQTPEHPDIVAEAYLAEARLGRPAPIEKLIQACSEASHNASLRFLTAALHYYSQDDGDRFLKAYSTSLRRKSLAVAWHDVIGVVEISPEGPLRNRASRTFERTLYDAIPKTLAVSGPTADADLLMTLLCLWRLQTVSPEVLMKRLSEPTPQGARIWSRLSTMLVGDASNPPDELTLPDAWEIPDEWYAAVLAVNQEYPEPFVRKVLINRSDVKPHQQESRLLALSNIGSETARRALATDLSRSLFLYRDLWRTKDPHLISSICALLAAAGDKIADDALSRFLAPGPYAREFPAWDGLIVGSLVDPARHKALLKLAATHPLPSVWTRARQMLALAEGDVAAYRNPELRGPELPQPLTSLVDQFESAVTEADVLVIISRQRAAQLAEFALGLSGSPGAVAVLHSRMDRSESQLSTYLLLANQPVPLDRRRFDEFLRSEPPYQVFDPPIMIGHVLRNDLRSLPTFRSLALGPRLGRNSPPLLHRFIAMECYGVLQTVPAPPEIAVELATPAVVSEILSVIDRDASVLVRHAAAAAALRCVKKEDKALLIDFAAKHPDLPRGVANLLNLASKL